MVASQCDGPESNLAGWTFFRDYYLVPDPTCDFDPGFYTGGLKPISDLHIQIVKARYTHRRSAFVAPRGSAKTTTSESIALRDLVTKPGIRVNFFRATDDFASDSISNLKIQLETNPRILEDFGVLKPSKNFGKWNNHALWCMNRARGRGYSMEGRKRGPRGDLIILDDIEDDKSDKTRNEARVQELTESLLKVIMPMLDWECNLLMVGTLISLRSFLYHVYDTEEDKRFRSIANGGPWFKLNVAASDAQGRNAWDAKYTEAFLQDKQDAMGLFYGGEYMGRPTSEETTLFKWDDSKHTYSVDPVPDPAATVWDAPDAKVSYLEVSSAGNTQRTVPWRDLVTVMQRGITVDYAPGLTTGADYSAVVCWGVDTRNNLWVLDGYQERGITPQALADVIWNMAYKWRVSLIANEQVTIQQVLINEVNDKAARFAADYGFQPTLVQVKYPGNVPKENRIGWLEYRFRYGMVKLPKWRTPRLVTSKPDFMYVLKSQITGFTMDGRGLRYDDALDALAQAQYITKAGTKVPPPPPTARTPIDAMLAGDLFVEGTNVPLALGVDLNRIPLEVHDEIRRRHFLMLENRDPYGVHGDPSLNYDILI